MKNRIRLRIRVCFGSVRARKINENNYEQFTNNLVKSFKLFFFILYGRSWTKYGSGGG